MIKNKNNTDVAFVVQMVKGLKEGKVIKGFWINILHGPPHYIDKDLIFIKNDNLEDWEIIDVF